MAHYKILLIFLASCLITTGLTADPNESRDSVIDKMLGNEKTKTDQPKASRQGGLKPAATSAPKISCDNQVRLLITANRDREAANIWPDNATRKFKCNSVRTSYAEYQRILSIANQCKILPDRGAVAEKYQRWATSMGENISYYCDQN